MTETTLWHRGGGAASLPMMHTDALYKLSSSPHHHACGLCVVLNPTCHFDVACSLGNVVFNHTGVGGISSNVVQKGNHFQSDVFSIQLIAGVGKVR